MSAGSGSSEWADIALPTGWTQQAFLANMHALLHTDEELPPLCIEMTQLAATGKCTLREGEYEHSQYMEAAYRYDRKRERNYKRCLIVMHRVEGVPVIAGEEFWIAPLSERNSALLVKPRVIEPPYYFAWDAEDPPSPNTSFRVDHFVRERLCYGYNPPRPYYSLTIRRLDIVFFVHSDYSHQLKERLSHGFGSQKR